ncbi:PIN domain-containing protein [Roseobacter litoralis]|uniref:PIN domain-containing protein n=1 Tax=Roseobacter litoralis TaxID=42443 RepID=UPI00249514DD|nr:PIN domain-containing protein [Roseobacter litoralis]
MNDRFVDSNIILYLLEEGPKRDIANTLLTDGGIISVQVLNEVLSNCRRKAKMSWKESADFLSGFRELCHVISLNP